MASKIGVGIIGASADRGWARAAHFPALHGLSDFEIRALSTTSRETAERSARAFGVPLAFDNYHELLARPEIDLAVVAVNVTKHHEIASAALGARKMVYCEWPLGRDLNEARQLAAVARQSGVRTVIGLQGSFAPTVRYLRDLVAEGYVGELLGSSIKGCGPDDVWAGVLEPPFEFHADIANGATMLSIPAGHALEMLAYALGDFVHVSATLLARRGEALRVRDGARVPLTAYDEVAVTGELENGALASLHYHGGVSAGPDFVWEINGTEGNLLVTAEHGYANISPLEIHGGRGKDKSAPLSIPAHYRLAPADMADVAVNVASLYSQFARDIREETTVAPDFDRALRRHIVLNAIETANATGARQFVGVS